MIKRVRGVRRRKSDVCAQGYQVSLFFFSKPHRDKEKVSIDGAYNATVTETHCSIFSPSILMLWRGRVLNSDAELVPPPRAPAPTTAGATPKASARLAVAAGSSTPARGCDPGSPTATVLRSDTRSLSRPQGPEMQKTGLFLECNADVKG